MTITDIEAMTKTRFRVSVDGQVAFVLYKDELSRFHLEKGAEITRETYDDIRQQVVLKRAKTRALHLLEDMGRTESQLRTKLTADGYPADIVEETLSYVKSFGYVNDAEYARAFIENRKGRKSRKELYGALSGKGLDQEVIQTALDTYYEEADARTAIRTWMDKRHFDPEQATEAERTKFLSFLTRKGFRYEDIRAVISR